MSCNTEIIIIDNNSLMLDSLILMSDRPKSSAKLVTIEL